MEFHEHITTFDVNKKASVMINTGLSDYDTFYTHYINSSRANTTSFNLFNAEYMLWKRGKPYYLVYPGIIKYLTNLKEDKVMTNMISFPVDHVIFRFPVNDDSFDFVDNGIRYGLKTAMVSYINSKNILDTKPVTNDVMTVWMDFGESIKVSVGNKSIDAPIHMYKRIEIGNITLEDAIMKTANSKYDGLQVPSDIIAKVMRCIVSCSLISTSSEDGLVEPDVLNKDKAKYRETHDERLIEKARKRGKFGWLIGSEMTISPHWRSGTPLALYWTGPGRCTPKYRPRKGAIVHRKMVKDLPTGYSTEAAEDNL